LAIRPSALSHPNRHNASRRSCGLPCAGDLEQTLLREGPDSIAAFVVEPVQGTGGIIVPPPEYFAEVAEICRRHDVLLILDEVITGFGRTGRWFGMETYGARPDLVSFAKGITSGYLPLGAVGMTGGVYETLLDTTGHYIVPNMTFDDFLARGGVCSLVQFSDHPQCATIFPNVVQNSEAAFGAVVQARTTDIDATFEDTSTTPLSNAPLMLAFLEALTDPCTLDRACIAPWVPDPSEAADENQLNAVDALGAPL